MANNGKTTRRLSSTLGQPGATAVSAVLAAGSTKEFANGRISSRRAFRTGPASNAHSARLTQPWHPIVLAALLIVLLGASDTPEERRARIAALPPAEQQQLLARQERFSRLPQPEQEKLRRLDEELSGSSRQVELRQVMAAYHDWLKTLNPSQRDQLRQLPPAARLARVKELREQESKRSRHLLAEPDLQEVRKWLIEIARAEMPAEDRADIERQPEALQEMSLLWHAGNWFRQRDMRQQYWRRIFTSERIEFLNSSLSPEAQQMVVERPESEGFNGRRWLVFSWVQQFFAELKTQRPEFPSPEEMREALLSVFEKDLTKEQRERLMTLSREQRMRELGEEYMRKLGGQGFQPPRREQRREERREQRPLRRGDNPPADADGQNGPNPGGEPPSGDSSS